MREKKASIDIGSNTILLLAGEFSDEPFSFEEELNESRITSLGRDLDLTKNFHAESIEESFIALREYRELLVRHGHDPLETKVTATEAARVAKNANSFFKKVEEELGFKIKIINGEQEAFLSSYGVVKGSNLNDKNIVILDIGGASSELIKVSTDPFEVKKTISLPVGSIRAMDWKNRNIFEEEISSILNSSLLDLYKGRDVICVGGGLTTAMAMYLKLNEFDSKMVNNKEISIEEIIEFFNIHKNDSPDILLTKYPFIGKRASSILAGIEIGILISQRLEWKSLKISTLGLRYGSLFCEQL